MKRIALLDPSVGSQNLGDGVIMDAVSSTICELFPEAFVMRISTHEFMLWESYKILDQCDHIFVGGSNLLKSRMEWNNQWKISPLDYFRLRNCRLVAPGWWHYQRAPDYYSSRMLRRILARDGFHAVRDGYSQRQLAEAGVENVLNTGCVTMWCLDPAHCQGIPTHKADWAVTTLTGYNPDPIADSALIELLVSRYQRVFIWAQQTEDWAYSQQIGKGRLTYITPSLAAYTNFLQTQMVDYIGSRLHGGIRALQSGKRSLILAVDNRAIEISKDTRLPVVPRTALDSIAHWIDHPSPTELNLPTDAISNWKGQFSSRAD